jgi:pre-mRNA-splicing factor 18
VPRPGLLPISALEAVLTDFGMSSLAGLQARVEARKRKLAAAVTAGNTSPSVTAAKRWRRKGDLDADADRAYRDKQSERDAVRREASTAAHTEVRTAAEGQKGDNELKAEDMVDRDGPPPLGKEDVVRRLRSHAEPSTLFGEDDWARFGRLRDTELAREAEGRGQKNIFQNKLREMQREDAVRDAQEYAGALLPQKPSSVVAADTAKNHIEDRGCDGFRSGGAGNVLKYAREKVIYSHFDAAASVCADNTAAPVDERFCTEDYVHGQIQRWVGLWQKDVDSMAPELRRTNKGRSTAATLEQTKEWFKPLYKQLRNRKLSQNILSALVNIFKAVDEREYVRANSFYYEQLAIGNAPWPMGATMVGIHARAAREKIGEGRIAHVMNDEQSRKYIQGVKRLITKAQTHFPTVPSKMISS